MEQEYLSKAGENTSDYKVGLLTWVNGPSAVANAFGVITDLTWMEIAGLLTPIGCLLVGLIMYRGPTRKEVT